MKKASSDVIILHMCTINDNHMMYGSFRPSQIIFFVHEISRKKNRFRYASGYVRNRARKTADVLVTNNNMIQQ